MPTFTTTGIDHRLHAWLDVLTIAQATGLRRHRHDGQTGAWPTTADRRVGLHGGHGRARLLPRRRRRRQAGHRDPSWVKIGDGAAFGQRRLRSARHEPFTYRGAPLVERARRAARARGAPAGAPPTSHIGVRTRLGGGGVIGADCASGVGDSVARDRIDSRVWRSATTRQRHPLRARRRGRVRRRRARRSTTSSPRTRTPPADRRRHPARCRGEPARSDAEQGHALVAGAARRPAARPSPAPTCAARRSRHAH